MAESLTIREGLTSEQKYKTLLPQVKALIGGETSLIANMANLSAVVHATFGFHWVGFYLVENDDELVLGPFQGPVACTRLKKGHGVCAAAWEKAQTIIVPDVHAFPGHVACSPFSKSEIVVPVKNAENEVIAVFDIDSDKLDDFSTSDRDGLEAFVETLKYSRL